VIVVDTGAVLALLDRDDRHHASVARLHEEHGAEWILPWAILPEVDYLASTRLGTHVAAAFAEDLRDGLFTIDAHVSRDLARAVELLTTYSKLALGLVDCVVMAQAERHRARIIATTDARDFRAVTLDITPAPRLVPIDD
jgi:hypothetical protein